MPESMDNSDKSRIAAALEYPYLLRFKALQYIANGSIALRYGNGDAA